MDSLDRMVSILLFSYLNEHRWTKSVVPVNVKSSSI